MKKKLWIFSLGGNEVSPMDTKDPVTGKPVNPDINMQWQRTVATCQQIGNFIEKHPNDYYVLTHGNGPQVGNILLRAEYSRPILHPLTLDICGADSQGAMGYMLAQLSNDLRLRGIDKVCAEIVTQVVVSEKDPDFQNPSKFIGPQFSKTDALARQEKDGWKVKKYSTDTSGVEIWRRVVPSPEPRDIVEIEAVERQFLSGMIPITVGGGGIPVVAIEPKQEGKDEVYYCNHGVTYRRPNAAGKRAVPIYSGVEAVIDKDLASALLGKMLLDRAKKRGEELDVSLAIFTAEDGVKLNYKKPNQQDLRKLSLKEAQEIYKNNPDAFPAGSMGPKLKAVLNFLEAGGTTAMITKTALFEKTLSGEAGTTITR